MGWPEYTWIGLALFGWVGHLVLHGKPMQKQNGEPMKWDVGIRTAGIGIAVLLLWQGGFFQ